MPSTTLGVKVDEATRTRLAALAEIKDRSPHWILRTALEEYLAREEHRERERREDGERWERYMATGEAVPGPNVRAWLEALAAGNDAPCPR